MRTVQTDNWLSWRKKGIGGSDAGAVMNALPWSNPFQLWAEKTGRLKSPPPNFAMKRGVELEPVARKLYEELTGIPMPVILGENDSWAFVRASFDGYNPDAGRCLEIKCPGETDHSTALRGEIPAKYIWQCVHLCLVSGLNYCDYFSYHPDAPKKYALITFKRNASLEKRLVTEEKRFWKYVVDDKMPPREEPAYIDEHKVFKIKNRSGR